MALFIKQYITFVFLLFFAIILIASCNKNDITTSSSDRLSFSCFQLCGDISCYDRTCDTISFDTVFTSVGTTTNGFIVHNNNNQAINISKVYLGGGTSSSFRINFDGEPAKEYSDVLIPANDSLYMFVEATLDPNNENTPFIITDSLTFETNGNIQRVKLIAWGQNAHFFGKGTPNGDTICTQTWTADKPYVIYKQIYIAPNCTLSIEAGTKIYLHNGANIVVDGSLQVLGNSADTSKMVSFQGTRLEKYYQEVPGQWGTIYFSANSKNNVIDGAIIRCGVYGILADSVTVSNNTPNLIIKNTQIKNMYDSGILAFSSVIGASNCLIYNCGKQCVQLRYGGVYGFINCTFVNLGNTIDHKDASIFVTNCLCTSTATASLGLATQATFQNCVVYGNRLGETTEEIELYNLSNNTNDLLLSFDHCLLKTERDSSIYVDCIKNPAAEDTLFVNGREGDFRLNNESACINKGLSNVNLQIGSAVLNPNPDILGTLRTENWDIGCFEYTE